MVDVVIPVELRIPDKGEAVELIGREGVKRRGGVIDGLGDAVKVQYRWRHGAARPGGVVSISQPKLVFSRPEQDVSGEA